MPSFPVSFTQCPACGGESRLVEEAVKKEVIVGRLPEGTRVPALISQTTLFNPADKTMLLVRREVPILMGFYDVCADCGCLYLVEMQQGVGIIEPQVKSQPPTGKIPPFFGRG